MQQEHRVFVEWDSGAFISSLMPDFGAELSKLVEEFGPPDTVEFRAHGEGWTHAQPCADCGESLVTCGCE